MRVHPDQIARALEVDLGALVARYVKLSRKGRILVGLCPFHKEKSPSFKVENGRYHCFGCGADGDAIRWMQASAKMPFRDAVNALSSDAGPRTSRPISQKTAEFDRHQAEKVREARAIWAQARSINGTRAADYLKARGIVEVDNPSLRYFSAFQYAPGVFLPAMAAALLSPEREIVAVQITWLSPVKPEKAAVATCRKTYGAMGDGAVRLGRAGTCMGLAEGVETGLSAMQISGKPVWCCLGAPRMHRVFVPDSVDELILFGDNDEPGREAVIRTTAAHSHRRAIAQFPPGTLNDWNDHLRAGAR